MFTGSSILQEHELLLSSSCKYFICTKQERYVFSPYTKGQDGGVSYNAERGLVDVFIIHNGNNAIVD